MNEILKKRIEDASEYFVHLYPKISVADVITSRRDAFQAGAIHALQNQWISVEEALPPYEESVLVVDKTFEESHGRYFNHRSNDPNTKTYKNGFCDLFGEAGEVIYWMPIPELKLNNG